MTDMLRRLAEVSSQSGSREERSRLLLDCADRLGGERSP